jgi:TolB-like protein
MWVRNNKKVKSVDRPFPAYKGDDPYIFVSYAHDDADLGYPEMQRLRDLGFNVWYDEGIRPGSTWREEVALALTESRLFLYFVTPSSVNSENCHQELNFALSRERKILSVHLVETKLSMGIELSLSNKQAIIKKDLSETAYAAKLGDAIRDMMPKIMPVGLPGVTDKPAADAKSVAILPFANRSSDPENEYLCDGIAEELITGLSKIEDLRVASQLSSFGLKGQNLDTIGIGKKLNIANVLTGSVQKSGERVRVTVTLTEAETGDVVWSERYDGTLEDVFLLQDDVANKVVKALEVELGTAKETVVIDSATDNPAAYRYYLQGRYEFLKQTRQGFIAAHEHFAKAEQADPNFGRAYWLDFVTWNRQREDGFVPASEASLQSRSLIEQMKLTSFEAPAPEAWIERWLDPKSIPDEKTLALENLQKIASKDKSWHGFQFMLMGETLQSAGLLNGACEYFEYYMSHWPEHTSNTAIMDFYGNLLFRLGRFDKAIEHFSNVVANEPEMILALGTRAMLYSRTGQYAKAEADLAVLTETFPRNFAQFYDLYWRRELDAAKAYFEWMESQRNLMPLFKIWGCFLLGYIDKGMDYLESLDFAPAFFRTVALYALTPSIIREVTSHPRYKAILAKSGMDDVWRDELMVKVNELEPITGIRVALDEDY